MTHQHLQMILDAFFISLVLIIFNRPVTQWARNDQQGKSIVHNICVENDSTECSTKIYRDFNGSAQKKAFLMYSTCR